MNEFQRDNQRNRKIDQEPAQFITIDDGSSVRQLASPELAPPRTSRPGQHQNQRPAGRQSTTGYKQLLGLKDWFVFGVVILVSVALIVANLMSQSEVIIQERVLTEIEAQNLVIQKDIDRMNQQMAEQYEYGAIKEAAKEAGLETNPSRVKVVEE